MLTVTYDYKKQSENAIKQDLFDKTLQKMLRAQGFTYLRLETIGDKREMVFLHHGEKEKVKKLPDFSGPDYPHVESFKKPKPKRARSFRKKNKE